MNHCIDPKVGEMLYAYELGKLTEDDRRAFEVHLIECEYCCNRARKFHEAAEIIRSDQEIRDYVASMVAKDRPEEEKRPQEAVDEKHRNRLWTVLIPVTAVILVVLLVTDWQMEIRPSRETYAAENNLLVIPFENVADADDSGRLSEIIGNLLITDLAESQYLNLVSYQHLRDILKYLQLADSASLGDKTALKIAQEGKAKWVLTGSILQTEPQIVTVSQIIEVASGEVIASQRILGAPDDNIFSFVDKLTAEVKRDLALPAVALEEADRPIAEMTTHSPDAYRAYLDGVNFEAKKYKLEAIESYKKAIEYDSTFAMAYYALADLGYSDLIDKAMEYIDRASRIQQHYIRSRYYVINIDYPQAIAELEKVLERNPFEKDALFQLGAINYDLGKYQESIRYLRRAVEADSLYKVAINHLVYAYNEVGDLENAIMAINRYIEIAPDEANPYDTRGDLYTGDGRIDEAMLSYQKALEIKPDFYASLEKLGQLYLYQRNYTSADSCFRSLMQSDDAAYRAGARYYLALTLILTGRFNEALKSLDEFIIADSTDGLQILSIAKLFGKSRIFLEKNELDSALAAAKKCHELSQKILPRLEPAYYKLYIQTLAESGQLEKARENLKTLLTLDTVDLSSEHYYDYALGYIEFQAGNYKAAIDAFENAVLSADEFCTCFMLGRSYLIDGQLSDAVTIFEKLLKDYSFSRLFWTIWNVKLHYFLGQAYEESRWHDKAVEQYEIFLSMWPDPDIDIPEVRDARARLTRLKTQL